MLVYTYPDNKAFWIEMEVLGEVVQIAKKQLKMGVRYSTRTVQFLEIPVEALEAIAGKLLQGLSEHQGELVDGQVQGV